jgi:hypothetical protein
MADGQATKVFLPTEATALLGALGGMRELLSSEPAANGPRAAATRPRRSPAT